MTITLAKGQKISLAKNAGLSRVMMGLGWDAVQPEPKKGGFLSGMFGGGSAERKDIDLDASVICFDASGRVAETVWFRQLNAFGNAIKHSGDNLTGEGDGDDETITLDLSRLPETITSLVFTVNSFRGQTFNEVENAVCRLVDLSGNSEICNFNISQKGGHTGMVMATLRRLNGAWEMQAIGEPSNGRTAADLATVATRFI